jgi:uncharacterized membrane protein
VIFETRNGRLLTARILPMFGLTFALFGCANGGSSATTTASFSNSYSVSALNILKTNCTSCHGDSSGPAGVYGLGDVTHMVATGLIVAGNPARSKIYEAISGGTMPQSGRLSAADQSTIQQWISLAAAPTPAPTPIPNAVSFATLEATIFQAKCVACHSDMSTYAGVTAYVNLASPQTSSIYVRTSSGSMPTTGSLLTATQENLLLQWIQAGAPNN